MTDVQEAVSVLEAARRLGITGEKAYELVLSKQLRSVEGPTGRRLVPVGEIERWRATHPVSA